MADQHAPPALVLLPDPDRAPTGLGVVRCLGREGVPVITANAARQPMSASSRYVTEHFTLPSMQESVPLYLKSLVERASALPAKPVLFVSADEHCVVVNSNRELLSGHLSFSYLSDEALAKSMDKRAMFEGAAEAGVPVPATAFISSPAEADRALAEMAYPCVMKPVSWVSAAEEHCSHDWAFHHAFRQKAVRADSEDDLRRLAARALDAGVAVVVQEEVIGDCKQIWMVSLYANSTGETWMTPVLQKTRQYPSDFGIACCIKTPPAPDIASLAEELVRSIGFVGIADIEFKKHHVTGEYCLMEINPRPATWASAAAANGVNIPYIAYCELAGLPVPEADAALARMTWVDSWNDTAYFLRYRRGDHTGATLSWSEWRRSLRPPCEGAYFTSDDPLPGLRRACDLGWGLARGACRRLVRAVRRPADK